jgi:hypothetical protein
VKLFACSIFTLVWAAALYAAPLDRRELPADVKWFLHVDADGGRMSQVGSSVIEATRGDPIVTRSLAKFHEVFNIDPTKDLHAVTVYGTDFTPQAAVLIIRGRLDREKIISLVQGAPEYHMEVYQTHPLFTWNEAGPGQPPHRSTGAIFDSETIIVGPEEAAVKHALDALDKRIPPLTSTDSPLAKAGPEGSIVEGGALGLGMAAGVPLESPVLRQCDYGLMWAGEKDHQVFFGGVAIMSSADVAEKVAAFMQGTKALALLNGSGDDADIGHLLAPMQIRTEDRAVNVSWQMPADKVSEILIGALTKTFGIERAKGPQTKP